MELLPSHLPILKTAVEQLAKSSSIDTSDSFKAHHKAQLCLGSRDADPVAVSIKCLHFQKVNFPYHCGKDCPEAKAKHQPCADISICP